MLLISAIFFSLLQANSSYAIEGNATELYKAGQDYFRGLHGKEINHKLAQDNLEQYLGALDVNDARRVNSLYMLGVINYVGGFGATENRKKSVEYLEKVLNDRYKSDFSRREAARYLGVIYSDIYGHIKKNGVKQDYKKAKEYFEIVLENKSNSNSEENEVNDMLKLVSRMGNESVQVACYELGRMYELGTEATPKDLEKAFNTYKRGAADLKGKCVVAVTDLKLRYNAEKNISKEAFLKVYEGSLKLYELLAVENENVHAMVSAGQLYLDMFNGVTGMDSNEEKITKGVNFLEQASAKGSKEALTVLLDFYLRETRTKTGAKKAEYERKVQEINKKVYAPSQQ